MKRRFSKILGVGLTLALLTSLLLTAAPVSADVSSVTVTVDPTTISAVDADYAIRFQPGKELHGPADVTSTGGSYDLFRVGDAFTITAVAGDSGSLTVATGSVALTLTGGATITDTNADGILVIAAGDSETWTANTGGTVVVTASAANTDGTWGKTTTSTAAVTAGTTGDNIVLTFPSGTTVDAVTATYNTATIVASQGWMGSPAAWDVAVLGTPNFTGDATARTVTIVLDTYLDVIGEGAQIRINLPDGIDNPSAAGSYKLTVKTSQETTAVTSAAYAITVPTIPGLPGVASVYNSVGVLMAQKIDLSEAVGVAGVDYTIKVGPGTYIDVITFSATTHKGLTFVSTDGAATTIIEGTITVAAAEVTVEGFTVKATSGCAISVTGADAIVQDNVITRKGTTGYPQGINVSGSKATVSGNELSLYTTMHVSGTGNTLSGNIFGAGINVDGGTNITITDNDLTGSELVGIRFEGNCTDVLIEGNTISGVTASTTVGDAGIGFIGTLTVTNLQIIGNDITDNEGDGIAIPSTVTLTNCAIKFNTITGNDSTTGDYGIQNDSATIAVDATLNWWGTTVAADIAKMVKGTVTGKVNYEPFLTGTAEAVFSASDVAVGATSIAKDTAGVAVSVTSTATIPPDVDIIAVAKYIANPEEALDGAIAFYDVYVAGTFTDPLKDKATIKFYAGDANTEVYIWSAGTLTWGAVTPVAFSTYGGYVYVTVDPAMLAGTPFALVAGTADPIEAPEIFSPVTGDDTVRLRPVFAWEAVTGADGYYFQLADNASFVVPLVKMEGDTGRLSGTTYAYVGEALPYSTAYHWRVKAVSGTEAAGDLAESGWAEGVFITMDEPVEPTPPVVVKDVPPVIIEPIVEVEVITPAATEITPSWIYVIIAVGGVLVISLVVLIVRTRRVA